MINLRPLFFFNYTSGDFCIELLCVGVVKVTGHRGYTITFYVCEREWVYLSRAERDYFK